MKRRRNPYRRDEADGNIFSRLFSRLKRIHITFVGHEGRWWRRAAALLAAVLVIVIGAIALRPETQIMNSVELVRARDRGTIYIGVRDDVPRFNEGGEGLEQELARMLAARILPDAEEPYRFIECSSQTVSTKISDGSIDVAIALLPKGKSRSYAYSYSYYTDEVRIVTLKSEFTSSAPIDLTLGYVQGTPAGDVLTAYQKEVTAVKEQSFFEKLFKKPTETVVVEEAKNMELHKYGSYEELIDALMRGSVDGAVMAGAYINKYFKVYAAEYTGRAKYYLNDTVIGEVEYSFVSSSDEPAFMQLADIMIYEMEKDGSLAELLEKYGLE